MHRTSVLLLSSADQEPQGPGAPGAQWAPTAFGGGRRFAPLHGKSGNTEKAEKTENGKSGKTEKTARIDWKSIIEDGPKMARPEIHHRGWALWIDRKSIIEDGPQFPNRPKGTMGRPVSRYEVFAPVGPKQVHHRGWAGFGLKTCEGVHREGGRGEGNPSSLEPGLTLRPRSTD